MRSFETIFRFGPHLTGNYKENYDRKYWRIHMRQDIEVQNWKFPEKAFSVQARPVQVMVFDLGYLTMVAPWTQQVRYWKKL